MCCLMSTETPDVHMLRVVNVVNVRFHTLQKRTIVIFMDLLHVFKPMSQ